MCLSRLAKLGFTLKERIPAKENESWFADAPKIKHRAIRIATEFWYLNISRKIEKKFSIRIQLAWNVCPGLWENSEEDST